MQRPPKRSESPSFFLERRKPKPSPIYQTYWRFAAKRQAIFFNRLKVSLPPWTDDPILQQFKFTNVYRATDRVSQYLIKNVIYQGDQSPRELLFRILLFKLFNKIETWELLSNHFGGISYREYKFAHYNQLLEGAMACGNAIYSGAYIMASGESAFGFSRKHQNHLMLIEKVIEDQLPERLGGLKSMEALYQLLIGYPTIGPFLGYQLATDINYSTLTNFSEMDFVKAGPGAKQGIAKCFSDFGDYSEEDIIRMMAEDQHHKFEQLGLEFQDLWGRPLQLIDCQNIFCEVDKYSRVAHPDVVGTSTRKRIKQKFSPTSITPIDYFLPPKWDVEIRF